MILDITPMMTGIDFAPRSEIKEILQNIRTIINTAKTTVPLNRDFGVDLSVLDAPVVAIKPLLTASIVEAINKWEPRAKVVEVKYSSNKDGSITPLVRVMIG